MRPDAIARTRTIERPPPDRARLTFVTDDPERARTFRGFAEHTHHEPELSVLESPAAADLRAAFEADRTAVYCELPVAAGAIRCPDGPLAFANLRDVGAAVVWLADAPAERAVEGLVDAGAIAVVLGDGAPSGSTVRSAFAQLLAGFSVADATYTAGVDRDGSIRFVGEAAVTVVRRVSKSPALVDLTPRGPDRYDSTIRCYPTDLIRQGTAVKPVGPDGPVGRLLEECNHDGYWLVGADIRQALPITGAEVASLVADDGFSVRLDGDLRVTFEDEPDRSTTVAREANGE